MFLKEFYTLTVQQGTVLILVTLNEKSVVCFHQAPAQKPRLVLAVSGGTIPAPSPALRPAVTRQLKPASPSHSETFDTLQLDLEGCIRPVQTFN